MHKKLSYETGSSSFELIILGLFAALVLVLAVPVFDTSTLEPAAQVQTAVGE